MTRVSDPLSTLSFPIAFDRGEEISNAKTALSKTLKNIQHKPIVCESGGNGKQNAAKQQKQCDNYGKISEPRNTTR